MNPLVIHGGLRFDGSDAGPMDNELLVMDGERITCLGGSCRIPKGARVLDAAGLSVMPGLTDLHVHFGAPTGRDLRRRLLALVWDYARHRPRHRQEFLDAGVTTIRSVGDVVGVRTDILDLRRRSASPDFRGPRVFTSGPLFTAPGGHPAATIYRGNRFLVRHATRQVSSVEAARVEVRSLVARGVDGIKAVYDSVGGTVPRLAPEVLEGIVDESHQQGIWVAVHTASAEDTRTAVLVGADTIEHGATDGSLLDGDIIGLMRSHGTTYVPTLAVLEAIERLRTNGERPPHGSREAWRAFLRHVERLGSEPLRGAMANVRAAVAGGVRIGAGTDAQGPRMTFGASLHREMELLVQAGLTARQTLLAATGHAAAALRVGGLGRIEVGSPADLVLVTGRPWEDIRDIRKVHLVIRAGRIVAPGRRRNLAASP